MNEDQSPDSSTAHIATALFNDPYLSDVQFVFNGCVIYAHSWILMNRSETFQMQLDLTSDVINVITVIDVEYAIFYQFIRFIYTDVCNVTADSKLDLLKLAVRYKIVELEMKLVNIKSINIEQHLALFEYCVVAKYEMAYQYTRDLIIFYLKLVLKCDRFPMIHPDALEEILKLKHVPGGIREIDFFNALVQWINYACQRYIIPFDQRRTCFNKFLRLIRFSCMEETELRSCLETNSDLFSYDEAALISLFGDGSKGRLEYVRPYETRPFFKSWRRKTKFTLSSGLILYGLRYGIKFNESAIELQISARNLVTNMVDQQNFKFEASTEIIILGDGFVLRPNFEYTIQVNYAIEEKMFKIFTRRRGESVIVNGPRDLVQMIESSGNLIEIFFKPIEVNSKT